MRNFSFIFDENCAGGLVLISKKRSLNSDLKFFKLRTIFLLILAYFGSKNLVLAQDRDSLTKASAGSFDQTNNTDSIENQKDITDIYRKIFGVEKSVSELKIGNGPYLSLAPAIGYSLPSGITGVVSANISFYSDTIKDKMSSILVNAFYSQYHQYWVTINSNIINEKHNLYFVGDWWFYKFPTVTFGLGTKNFLSNAVHIDYNYLKIHQIVFYKFFPNWYAGAGYHLDYHLNIKEYNKLPELPTDFERYGKYKKSVSSGLSLDLQYDSRVNSVNAQSGMLAFVQYRNNPTYLGSTNNWQSLILEFRKFLKFPSNSKNIIAFWSYNDFTLSGKRPYLDLPGTGSDPYSGTGRGYTLARYKGKDFIYLETEYRFAITHNGLLGGVIYFNEESVTEWPSDKFQHIIPGGGAGIRIKINKHSNTNLALDYGIGVKGSKGFFFNIGEAF